MRARNFVVAALVAVTAGLFHMAPATPAFAQAPGEPPAQELSMARGELLAVDTDARVISVSAPDGEIWEFVYTDDTQIFGAQGSAAGLATATGAIVTVHYVTEGEINAARIIEIATEG